MNLPSGKQFLYLGLSILVLFLGMEYILPMILPFLLGSLIAFGAEPEVAFLERRLHFPRFLASLLGITLALIFLFGTLIGILSLLLRQLQKLGSALPDLMGTVSQGMSLLQGWLLGLAQNLPRELAGLCSDWIVSLFGSGNALLDRAVGWLLGFASGILGWIPGGALSLGTGILAAYMVSAKLPVLRASRIFQEDRFRGVLQKLTGLKEVLLSYGKAQFLLMSIIFAVLMLALFWLRVPFAPLWAVLIALVDAIPVLGTGTILIPWSIICMLQGSHSRSIGLLFLYAATTLGRTVLEPKFLGRELGLDPLLTLMALYIGFRLWGVWGLVLSPLAAVVILRFFPRIS